MNNTCSYFMNFKILPSPWQWFLLQINRWLSDSIHSIHFHLHAPGEKRSFLICWERKGFCECIAENETPELGLSSTVRKASFWGEHVRWPGGGVRYSCHSGGHTPMTPCLSLEDSYIHSISSTRKFCASYLQVMLLV